MGCATSKHDDSPAVVLCRERCAFLDEAVRQRYAFAEAHMAYLHSLKEVGHSLDRFFNQDPDGSLHGPPSPVLNLPAQRKGDPHSPEPSGSPPEKIHHHLPSRSDSGSHLHFHSDDSDDEDGSGSESLHHHDVSSPVHQQQHMPYGGYFPGYENLNLNIPGGGGGGGGGYMNVNYMKKQTTPSVVYTQRPMSPETMYMGESSVPSSSYYPNNNYSSNQNSNPSYPMYNFNNGYSNYGAGGGYYGGSSPPAQYGGGYSSAPAVASTSKAPPPPPSPPSSSAWDFLNPFESYEKFYPPYTPSRDSREVREEEGIPDLEDEEDEVVKEVHGDQKFAESGRSSYSKPGVSEEETRGVHDAELQYRARPSVGMESDPAKNTLMLGKRSRPTFRRTSSMSGVTIDVANLEAAPPPPPATVGGEFHHMLSPRFVRKTYSGGFHADTADFLRSCGLCNRHLTPGRDIYMYRGDTAFCSLECREQQMKQDERKERRAAAKGGPPEAAAATPEVETVAAA